MEIITKFNLDDGFYAIYGGKISKLLIDKIYNEHSVVGTVIEYRARVLTTNDWTYVRFNETACFKTKEELIKSLEG